MAFWFDTVLAPITISANQELALSLGTKTLVQLTGVAGFQIYGIAMTGGNVDGVVVTLMNLSNSGVTSYNFIHESTNASSVVNRFKNPSGVANSGISIGTNWGGITYRYDGITLRWHLISRS